MCDEGETADRADAVRTESQKMESRAGETALDGSARSIIVLIVVGMLVGVLSGTFGIGGGTVIVPALVWLGLSQRNAAATSTGSPQLCCSAACSLADRSAVGCCHGCRNWCCGGFSWRFSCSW